MSKLTAERERDISKTNNKTRIGDESKSSLLYSTAVGTNKSRERSANILWPLTKPRGRVTILFGLMKKKKRDLQGCYS